MHQVDGRGWVHVKGGVLAPLTMDIFQAAYNLSLKHLNRSSRAYSI